MSRAAGGRERKKEAHAHPGAEPRYPLPSPSRPSVSGTATRKKEGATPSSRFFFFSTVLVLVRSIVAAMSAASFAPAASSFAASRKDVLSSIAFFFGDPASPEKLRDYSEHQAATYHFPGKNTHARTRARLCPRPVAYQRALRFCIRSLCVLGTRLSRVPCFLCLCESIRLLWTEYPHSRHAEQPRAQIAPGLADQRRPSLCSDHRHRRGVGCTRQREPRTQKIAIPNKTTDGCHNAVFFFSTFTGDALRRPPSAARSERR